MQQLEDCFHLGVKALISNHEGEVLLLESPSKNNETNWDIPGGRIQKNESLSSALARELEEETGLLNIGPMTPFIMVLTSFRIPTQNDSVGLIFSVYQCNLEFSFTPRLSSEHVNFGWFKPKEAARLLKKYPTEFIDKLNLLDLDKALI